jgi:aldose 1-epimerase
VNQISPVSGEQWTIRDGDQEVTVVEVGGGLRTYRVGNADVLAGYGADEFCRAGRGQVLMPWPNRIRDGRYAFGGTEHQLALTEAAFHNASHGLVRWSSWAAVPRSDESSLTVAMRLFPQPGWDGCLDIATTYRLGDDGLSVTPAVTNAGEVEVPFGYGAHPYVALGDTPLAQVQLTVPGAMEVVVDEQKIPTATEPVRPETDFRTARVLGSTSLDTAFTGLSRSTQTGAWEVVVGGLADGGSVTVWGDEAFDWAQVFTAKGADTGVEGSRGIAVEPMSCPANAFNSGEGLVVLRPGQSWTGSWGVKPSALG